MFTCRRVLLPANQLAKRRGSLATVSNPLIDPLSFPPLLSLFVSPPFLPFNSGPSGFVPLGIKPNCY